MLRRALALAVAVAALALPAQVAADVPQTGTGFFVADDDGATFHNPADMPSLGEGFKRLNPQVFRLMLIWNAMEPAPANATPEQVTRAQNRAKWVARTHAMIKRAREQGVTQIILTLRDNGESFFDTGSASPDAYLPSATKYETEVAKVVKEFAGEVDVWGGINEPNLWVQSDGNGNRAIPVSTLVDYQASIAEVVTVWDPTAMVTSPDFNDETSNWKTYVENYKAAGGGFGNVAAFHPYKAAATSSLTTVNEYAAIVPAGRNIWATEVGVKPPVTSIGKDVAAQATKAHWMIDTVNGLASVDRLTRIGYYHVRDHNPAWDSALLYNDLRRRPAWYTWCAAAHGGNLSHPDCATQADRFGVWQPSTYFWVTPWLASIPGATSYLTWGLSGDIPVAGDWNGDGRDSLGIFRPSNGLWHLTNSVSGPAAIEHGTTYGGPGDLPVVGDWNGDGIDSVGVYRPSNATWYLSNVNNGATTTNYQFNYGLNGDRPVAGDWDGNGFDSVGVFRNSNANWYLTNTIAPGAPVHYAFNYGLPNDRPVAGDWDGNGYDSIGIVRPSNNAWQLTDSFSALGVHYYFVYGNPNDYPIVGDWNGG